MAHAPVLYDLPSELLHLIFEYFCLHCRGGFKEPYWAESDAGHEQSETYLCDRRTLFSLCLVSRRMRDVAQRILHHQFIPGYFRLEGLRPYSSWGRLTSFIRTVATRRDLAALVKTICLHHWLPGGIELDDACVAMRHAADALQVDLAEIWKKRGMDDREWSRKTVFELHRYLFLGDPDGVDQVNNDLKQYPCCLAPELYAVLLALLPNLKHFAFRTVAGIFTDVPETAMSALGVTKLPLQTLETAFTPKYLSRLTQDLENLTLDSLDPLGFLDYCLEKFDFPRLKSVRLRGLFVNEEDFGRIVESCPDSLSSFTYETSGALETNIRVVQPSDVVAQLSKFRGTLKTLRLDLRSMTLVLYRIRMDTLPSLEGFTALESLFLTTNAMYHEPDPELADENSLVDILPPNIVSLTLAKTTWTITQRLRRGLLGLAECRQRNPERFCKLKLIQCDMEEVCFDSYVKDALREVSIDLEYEEFPRLDWSYDGF